MGCNSRLDEVQAAVLRVKLAALDGHNDARRALAERYRRRLTGVGLPAECPVGAAVRHAYHLYVIRHPRRDALRARLAERGVGTLVHYPVPVHLQPAYADLGYRPGSLPHTERAAREVLSLPLYPGLTDAQQDRVIEAIHSCRAEAA